jgi:signal recognition particle GTPase
MITERRKIMSGIVIDGVYDSRVLNIFDEVTDEARNAVYSRDAVLLVATRGCGKLELLNEYARQLLEEDEKCICVCTNDELREAIEKGMRNESFSVSIDSFISPEAWADKMAKLELPNDHGRVCTKRYKQNNNFFNNKEYYRRERISKLMEKHKGE